MVEPILYAALGALVATLFGLMFLPLFWHRAVRLTTKQLIGRLPVSAAEIVAAQDRLRAEHAMSMRQTERKAERAMNDATRDRVDSARARATELGHLADLADLRAQVAALEAERTEVRSQLEITGQEAATAFEALKEARAAAAAAARDLQAARQDASAARAATEQARVEIASRVAEIAALRARLATGDGKATAVALPSPVSHRLSLPKADTPFGALADEPSPASDPEGLKALRRRLDEVADAIVRAAEAAPLADMRSRDAGPAEGKLAQKIDAPRVAERAEAKGFAAFRA